MQTYTINFSPAFATVPKFAMGLVALQRETQSETYWTLRIEIFSISASNAVLKAYCYNSEWMHFTWVKWIATIRTDVSIYFYDYTFSPVISSSNNNVIKTLSLTLPSNPIVQTFLTGWDFSSSSWRMALYSSVNSFDTSANTVSLNFTVAQSNTWTKASGFVIAFS